VDQVMGQINKLTTLSGTISTNIANITNLSGKLATLSGKVNTLINNTNPTTNFDGKFATLSERVDNLYGRVNNLSEEVKNPKPHFTVGRRQNTAAMTGTINL
jgi:outer membrane murein-binding lipoprotein Lpp